MLTPEPVNWPDQVEVLIERLEFEAAERALNREERALMDVYEIIPILESEDCLHEFWQGEIDQQRVISSFDLIGATALVDPCGVGRPDFRQAGGKCEEPEKVTCTPSRDSINYSKP